MNGIIENIAIIPLTHGKVAIVDPHRYNALRMFHWRAVQAHRNWYAKTTLTKNGKTFDISMHRFVAQTPFGQVCHHKNRNSLDNRETNLVNMEKRSHSADHHDNNLIVKFSS